MKINKKVICLVAAGMLAFSFSIMAPPEEMRDDFHESGSDDTENGPRKQKPKERGLLDGLLKFFRLNSGKTGADGGKTDPTAVTGKGGKGADNDGNGTTVAGDSGGGNKAATAGDLAAEEAVGRVGKSFALPNKSATAQAKGKTLAEKEELVNKSDLSVTQKAIVKSLAGRTNDVELLIGAMKNVEMEIVDAMTGTRRNVLPDQNLTDKEFVNKLKLTEQGCLHRLRETTTNSGQREFDLLKYEIVENLLGKENERAREILFQSDIEPKVRAKKTEYRSSPR